MWLTCKLFVGAFVEKERGTYTEVMNGTRLITEGVCHYHIISFLNIWANIYK